MVPPGERQQLGFHTLKDKKTDFLSFNVSSFQFKREKSTAQT